MPEFKYIPVSYVCPECRHRGKAELPYIPTNLKVNMQKGRWCKCGARHKLTYQTRRKLTGEIILKVIEFISNDKTKPKNFRQLKGKEDE